MTLLLDLLGGYVLSGIPSNAAWDLLKGTWERANRKSWEDLYVDALEGALREMRPRLLRYGDNPEIGLDRQALLKALHQDLAISVDARTLRALASEKHSSELARAMEQRSVIVIGGHSLTEDDYRQLVHNLLSQADARFKEGIISNEAIFRRTILDEATTNRKVVEEIDSYLYAQFGVTLVKLDAIESKVNSQTDLVRQVAADVKVLKHTAEGSTETRAQGQQHIRRKVRIFVASPGDVLNERDRLADVIQQLNRGVADKLGLTLDLLRWETHVAPDVGRPQEVVFKQLPPEEWDIFVGILWQRFGTPTGKTDPDIGRETLSGTEEEFQSALQQRTQGGTGWPKVMFYRCLRNADLRTLDPEQYMRVTKFFGEFSPSGSHPGLVQNYEAAEEFERLVREHLEKLLWQFAEITKQPSAARSETPQTMLQIPLSTREIPPVNRKAELEMFRAILKGETSAKGLIIHSQGERGWGKSVLLRMFKQECLKSSSNTPVLDFDFSHFVMRGWQHILDQTTDALGVSHFPRYRNAVADLYSKEFAQESTGVKEGLSYTKRTVGEPGSGLEETVVYSETREQSYRPRSIDHTQWDVTQVFLDELQAISGVESVVWLIDSIEWIEPDTTAWLVKIFGQIAQERVSRLVVVAAGRESLYYSASWQGFVEELDIRRFDKAAIVDLLVYTGWISQVMRSEKICEEIAESLMVQTKGRPLDICNYLQRGRPRWEV